MAGGVSKISLMLTKLNKLTIYGSDTATVSVSASDIINKAIVQMTDRSIFQADNLLIRQKKLQLGAKTSIQLSGRSLADFGLKTE